MRTARKEGGRGGRFPALGRNEKTQAPTRAAEGGGGGRRRRRRRWRRHDAHRPGRKLGNVLEQLRLGDSGIAHQADVDVAANLQPVLRISSHSSHELEQQRFLHVLVAEDLGGDRHGELAVDHRVRLRRGDHVEHLVREARLPRVVAVRRLRDSDRHS